MKKGTKNSTRLHRGVSPRERLLRLVEDALGVATMARRHHQGLNGVNFYANKLANLRADATIAFGRMSGKSLGDTTAVAELMQQVFGTATPPKHRANAARELTFTLKTSWAKISDNHGDLEEGGVFPLVTLNQTQRGYLVSVGRQMNGCYSAGWLDACAVMMRRLLEGVIIE